MRIINGFTVINAPWSALNNAGMDESQHDKNTMLTKKIIKFIDNEKLIYPYISGQAERYWLKQVLESQFGWKLSPITRASKNAYTEADPIKYPDDDMFGYMRAEKKEKGAKNNADTLTRVAPFKNSPLVALYPQKPTIDFGAMMRQEGDPSPYEHEFYSVPLKGIFSIDVDMAGRFYAVNRSGYYNISEKKFEEFSNGTGLFGSNLIVNKEEKYVEIPKTEKVKRIVDVLKAFSYLYGGADSTRHLTDVTPKFIVLAFIDGGNHILMSLSEEDGLNFDAFKETVRAYSDAFLSNIFIGKQINFLSNYDDVLEELTKASWTNTTTGQIIGVKYFKTAKDAVDAFVEEVKSLI